MSDTLQSTGPDDVQLMSPLHAPIKRRSFFLYAGATTLMLAGCSKDNDNPPATNTTVDVGSGDTGVLNYAYALEQLEAAFYAQVLRSAYFTSLDPASAERQILADIALHEQIHADFFKSVLAGNAIRQLTPDFSGIDFSQRLSMGGKLGVLDAARAFEDLGVQAYNGAGRFITDPRNLVLAGKIVSVEARHASLIRDLIRPNSFMGDISAGFTPDTLGEDVIDRSVTSRTARQEKSKLPAQVLAIANTFLAADSKVSANSLVS
ncbi:ferritin-like domain-containing protein [Hymenobacter sp. BT664]|uniref:Ferritin-like domain-containing protein n=1 Tax=Hymenobacter montanus TaxID=2771359 RepID=A0A927GI50_9BACT|nr:ferritin-like domain-containing protein [Hymenobacter montanus]MBD2767093.1 ferritin-like domain-containing protein [Hymenobacter montanus]